MKLVEISIGNVDSFDETIVLSFGVSNFISRSEISVKLFLPNVEQKNASFFLIETEFSTDLGFGNW